MVIFFIDDDLLPMAKQSTEYLAAFFKRPKSGVLVDVSVELASQCDGVKAVLARLQLMDDHYKVAAGFRKNLSAWRHPKRYYC